MGSGIYAITHIDSGKQYIGSTTQHMSSRWAQHRYRLRKGSHGSKHLQNAWNKYGESAFRFEILELCEPEILLVQTLEQRYLDSLRPIYNANPSAFTTTGAHLKGTKLNPKHSQKISKALTGKPKSIEHKQKVALANIGKIRSEESKQKQSESTKGKPKSPEHRAKLAEKNQATRFKPGHGKGRKLSPETIAKRLATLAKKRGAV